MSTTPYDSFLVEVLPYMRDVPEIVAIQAVRNAVIEFCEKTQCLQEDLTTLSTFTGDSTYDIAPDTGYTTSEVMSVWLGDQYLVPKSVEDLTRVYRGQNWQDMIGRPYYYFREDPTTLRLVPKPALNDVYQLTVRIAMVPTRASTAVDISIYDRYLEIISFGARARLAATPNQPYYDPAGAGVYLSRFNAGIDDVKRRMNRGNVRATTAIGFNRIV